MEKKIPLMDNNQKLYGFALTTYNVCMCVFSHEEEGRRIILVVKD